MFNKIFIKQFILIISIISISALPIAILGDNIKCGDINEDDIVDIMDAFYIMQYYVGLIPELPCPTPFIQKLKSPLVKGISKTNDTTPTWEWISGGGGNGIYRYKLADSDLSIDSIITTETSYTQKNPLSPGSYTLYVQESNNLDQWSTIGSFTTEIDITPPYPPDVTGISPVASVRPTWTWTSGGGGNGIFRYKLDDSNMSCETIETIQTSFSPDFNLPIYSHTLFVQERDDAGNWSLTANKEIFIIPIIAIGWIGSSSNGWKTGKIQNTGNDYQSFVLPGGISTDSLGYIYICDISGNRVCKWDSEGNAIGWIGGGSDGWKTGNGAVPQNDLKSFNSPTSVFVHNSGNIYVADTGNHRVCMWDSEGNALGWIGGGSDGWKTGNGAVPQNDLKSFNSPTSVIIHTSGELYITDGNNNRVCKWDSEGNALGWIGGGSDGWKTTMVSLTRGTDYMSFSNPQNLFIDITGYIYIADRNNNRICKWDSNGYAMGCIGGGSDGWRTDNASNIAGQDDKSFNNPQGIFVHESGNIYIADTYNHRICKWDSEGYMLGWFGGGFDGWQNGLAPLNYTDLRSFNKPYSLYLDNSGNIYISDQGNFRVLKWTQ